MDGLVSKANDFFLFFVLEIAAAAAIPVGPADAVKTIGLECWKYINNINICLCTQSRNELNN